MTTAQEALNFNHMFNEFLLIKGSISGIVGDEKMGGRMASVGKVQGIGETLSRLDECDCSEHSNEREH